MDLLLQIKKVKQASLSLNNLSLQQRNAVLTSLAKNLRTAIPEILLANKRDLSSLQHNDPMYDRLLLNEARIESIATDIEKVATLPNPLDKNIEQRQLSNGLKILKVSVPLGVVAVIYEARPNVTIDVFSLCFKSGNACILKGGKEAYYSNSTFVDLIKQSLSANNIDPSCVCLFPPNREDAIILLRATGLIDVCIPRGSQALINFVRDHAKIPIIETGAGIVHTYFDKFADLVKGMAIINNAKTRRVSVCNALDCLLVHQDRLQDLPTLASILSQHNVEIFADERSYAVLSSHYPKSLLFNAKPDDFGREFLDYKLAIKTVSSVQEAIAHIMQYTSSHSEAIITEDKANAYLFTKLVDAAVVYVNASTAFTDGGQFGMGAEIGISTQKLHARGPMGLDTLTSYKWLVYGDGQIRT